MNRPLTREAVKALMDAATKGPWSWRYEDGTEWYLAPGILKVEVGMTDGTPHGDLVDVANSKLIASAPDLAAALLFAWDERDDALHRLKIETAVSTDLGRRAEAAYAQRDAVKKEFDAVIATLSEMHGAERSHAEAAEAKLAERDAEIARLRDAATAWQAFKDAHTVTDHWASVDRLDRALLNK